MSYLYNGGQSVKVREVSKDGDDVEVEFEALYGGYVYSSVRFTPKDMAKILAVALPEDPEGIYIPTPDEAAFAESIML